MAGRATPNRNQEKPKLSKEDEAAVRAQLEKEAVIRARVARGRALGLGAIAVVQALLNAGAATQPVLHGYLPPLLKSLVLPLLASSLLHYDAGELFLVRPSPSHKRKYAKKNGV